MTAREAGLFGPGSTTWRVHADPLTGLAGLRALLLEALHPACAAAPPGGDVWGALARGAEFLGVTTFGSAVEALVEGARARAAQVQVEVRAPGTLQRWSGDDVEVLAWAHCCRVDSCLAVVRRGGLALEDRHVDAYLAEQVRAAALVGLEPADVPHDAAALRAFFDVRRPALLATAASRETAAAAVRQPLPARWPPLPAWAPVAGLAYAALPRWARDLYALPELPGAAGLPEAATTAALRALRHQLLGGG